MSRYISLPLPENLLSMGRPRSQFSHSINYISEIDDQIPNSSLSTYSTDTYADNTVTITYNLGLSEVSTDDETG